MKLEDMQKIVEDDQTTVDMYMIHKINGKKSLGYSVVNPTIGKQLKDELKEIVANEIEKYKQEDEEPYNPVGVILNEVETAKTSDYSALGNIKSNMETPLIKFRFKNSSFNFFIYEFRNSSSNTRILAFRRTKNFKVFNKGFIGHFLDGRFEKIEAKDMLATDDEVDFIADESDIYIFKHISFERILNLKNKFLDKAKNVLDNNELSDKIEDFDKFKDSALKNQSYIKRIAKLDNNNTATLFLKDITSTKEVIDKFNLDIQIDDKTNKLIYRDESQISSYIGLMQDAYYQTLIGKKQGVDKRR